MALETNAELLGRVPIFRGLTASQLAAIAEQGCEVFFRDGTAILMSGESAEAAYLILSGFALAEAPAGLGLRPETLGYGALLGELAMLVETTFSVTVWAKWQVRALALPRAAMLQLMERDPTIACHFSEKLLSRLLQLAGDLRRVDADFAALETSFAERMLRSSGRDR